MTSRVVGVDDLSRGARALADDLGPRAVRGAERGVDRIAQQLRGAVPYLSGTLAGSVFVEVDTGTEDVAGVGYDGSAGYAAWIEWGGSRGRPYVPEGRYLWPLAEAGAGEVIDEIEQETAQLIRGYTWPNPT